MTVPKNSGVTRLWRAVGYSLAGFRHAIRNEPAVREEIVALTILVFVSVMLPVTAVEHLLLVLSLMLVVAIELLNSAIEAAIDRVSTEQHPLAGQAKDMASAAVLVALLMCGLTWMMIAGPVAWHWIRGFVG